MRKLLFISLYCFVFSAYCAGGEPTVALQPPIAKVVKEYKEKHGVHWIDDYAWIQSIDNPDVLSYVNAENAYTEAATKHLNTLQNTIYQELFYRSSQDDNNFIPFHSQSFLYYVKNDGPDALICRQKGNLEETIFDASQISGGKPNFNLEKFFISSKENLLAITYDEDGSMSYNLMFKDLKTKKFIEDKINNIAADVAFAPDETGIFYVAHDETMRDCQVKFHKFATTASEDLLIYEENDPLLFVKLSQSADKSQIFINSLGQDYSEVRYLDNKNAVLIQLKQKGVKYSVEKKDDNTFLLLTNQKANNFKIIELTKTGETKELVEHSEEIVIDSFQNLKDYLVLKIRQNGIAKIRVVDLNNSSHFYDLTFDEPTYTLELLSTDNFSQNILRFSFSSHITPKIIVDYNLLTKEKSCVKKDAAWKWFNRSQYITKSICATGRDNNLIPISLFYRKDMVQNGHNPTYLIGYGAYGDSYDPFFSIPLVSLVDRGFFVAIAHVRGGGEKGAKWYLEGKGLFKKNTFYDFICCAEHLIKENYTSSDKLIAFGRSAGGMLMGCIANWRADLFKAIVTEVPFVDVLNVMLDSSKPWTTYEYDEWGNPNELAYFETIKSYSPYDNVLTQKYPSMLITGSIHDTLVSFCEPTKWTAKLRKNKSDHNPLYLKIDMQGGHAPRANLTERLNHEAFKIAFILDTVNLNCCDNL